MVDGPRLSTKLGVCECVAFHDRHRGQVDPVRDVSHREDVWNVGSRILIHRNTAAGAHFHAGIEQPQARRSRDPAGGIHHAIGLDDLTAVELDGITSGHGTDRRHVALKMKLHALSRHLPAQKGPHVIVETAQDPVAPVDLVHL